MGSKRIKHPLATKIAEYLYANGSKEKGTRLLLVQEDQSGSAKVSNARYLGGWSQAAVEDAISDILNRAPKDLNQ